VGFGLSMRGAPREDIRKKVEEALALVRLESQADKLPGPRSGGQQQRVAIARAIVIEPPLVLMDEPLSNLDAKLRLEMRGEIRRIHNMLGSSTIYVTHDQDEAMSLADRIVVLRDGSVRQIGSPQDLYARPAHADVAEFMGYRNILTTEAKMNGSGHAEVAVGPARLSGTPVGTLQSGPATIAIRPDDLLPRAEGPIAARVQTIEYRGRDFYGMAKTAEGTELFFRSEAPLKPGEEIRLAAAPEQVLVYGREIR
jgi:putative spermidine/putrescine transport system ATP-binding protein